MASLCYNVSMATRKSVTKKTQIKLDSKNMSNILHKEFHDMYGNEFHLNVSANFRDPFLKQTVEYKGKKNNGGNN